MTPILLYSNLGYISKISTWNPAWTSAKMATTGIYALSTSDVNKLSDLPATFNSRIYMEALKAVSDETVYKIYNPHGKLSYVGFQYGTNAPIEWHQFITNTDLNPEVYIVPKPSDTSTFTFSNRSFQVYVRKSGKVVTIQLNISGSMAAVSDFVTAFTIPQKYKPLTDIVINYVTQNTAKAITLFITQNGEVKFTNFNTSIDDWLCRQCITYVTDN